MGGMGAPSEGWTPRQDPATPGAVLLTAAHLTYHPMVTAAPDPYALLAPREANGSPKPRSYNTGAGGEMGEKPHQGSPGISDSDSVSTIGTWMK